METVSERNSSNLLTQSGKNYGAMSSISIPETEDDAVSLAVKMLIRCLTIVISLWLLSYVIIMLQVIAKGHFVEWTCFLFIPMWLGSFLGLISVPLVLSRGLIIIMFVTRHILIHSCQCAV